MCVEGRWRLTKIVPPAFVSGKRFWLANPFGFLARQKKNYLQLCCWITLARFLEANILSKKDSKGLAILKGEDKIAQVNVGMAYCCPQLLN